MLNRSACPSLEARRQANQSSWDVTSTPNHFSTFKPVALAVSKHGRHVIVAKIVMMDGKPVLAVVHRNQRGVSDAISLPLSVIGYAVSKGCRWLVFRRDATPTTGEMWRISIGDVLNSGLVGRDDETYFKGDDMQPVRWQRWPFAPEIVDVDHPVGGAQ